MSKKTYRYGRGEKVEEDTFIDQENSEKGVFHHFTDEEEIKHLFKDFHIIIMMLKGNFRAVGYLPQRFKLSRL